MNPDQVNVDGLESWWAEAKNQNAFNDSIQELTMRMNQNPEKISETITIESLILPKGIGTLRVFALRAASNYPLERHLNSNQWIKTLSGNGSIEVHQENGEAIYHNLSDQMNGEKAWSLVHEKVWHRPINRSETLWITAAFHTAQKVIDEFA